MAATVFVLDFTDPPRGFVACDCCGDWAVELRKLDADGWTADTFICAACFGEADECEFTDLPLIQKAISHV